MVHYLLYLHFEIPSFMLSVLKQKSGEMPD